MPYMVVDNNATNFNIQLYDPNIIYFSDDFKGVDNWIVNGNYTITSDGINLGQNTSIISKNNIFSGKNFYTIKVRFKMTSIGDIILAGFTDENNNPTVYFKYNSGLGTIDAYLNGNIVSSSFWFPGGIDIWYDIYIVKGEKLIVFYINNPQYESTSIVYVMVDHTVQLNNLMFSTINSSATYNNLVMYESCGPRSPIPKPIWTNDNKILYDGNYYYFVTGEEYYQYYFDTIRLLILRTNDFINFEPYKHIYLGDVPDSFPQYAYFDGNNFYIWMINIDNAYQNGLHRLYLIVLDNKYNLVDINQNVTINTSQTEISFGGIYFINIEKTWYAIMSGTNGLYLFDGNPWTPNLTLIRQIYSDKYTNISLSAHLVKNDNSNYILIALPTTYNPDPSPGEPSEISPRMLISDIQFNNISELVRFTAYDEFERRIESNNIEFILSKNKVVYLGW
jgi:hypothetical protein